MAIDEEVKQDIQSAYSKWLSNNNCKPRRSQRIMIASIANALASIERDDEGLRAADFDQHISLIEAGTGTGKTLAYSIAAVILAKSLDKTLIIATATITLQEQLVFRDLPNLRETSGIDFSFALAKGRQRYLCLSKLAMRTQEGDAPLFPDEESTMALPSLERLRELEQSFDKGDWDGDRDRWVGSITNEEWRMVAADRASCSGKKCPQYHQCPLFKARDSVRSADVIVANHDLVLADLAAGGGNIFPDPGEVIFVFDEAHHLPEKSQNHLIQNIVFDAERARLRHSQKISMRTAKLLTKNLEVEQLVKELEQVDEGLDASLLLLQPMLEDTFHRLAKDINSSNELRLADGLVPDELRPVFKELADCFALKSARLQKLSNLVLATFTEVRNSEQTVRESVFAALGDLVSRCEAAHKVCMDYLRPDLVDSVPLVRWFKRDEDDPASIVAYSAPLSISETLQSIVWDRCYAAVLTSATLTALGNFEHISRQAGLTNCSKTYKIWGELNFAESVFHVPPMKSDPTQVELHTHEVIQILPELLSPKGGTLALFTSRRQMEAVYEGLGAVHRELILMQGDVSKQAIVDQHKAKIDDGDISILFGLASFAEGLDLPGDYCNQVIIAKLPFAVPDNPIDEARGEWIERNGGSAFWDIAVPAVSIKLLQASGRLLRHESDVGRVSLLDTRVVTKRYGKQILKNLPPFKLAL